MVGRVVGKLGLFELRGIVEDGDAGGAILIEQHGENFAALWSIDTFGIQVVRLEAYDILNLFADGAGDCLVILVAEGTVIAEDFD